LNTPGHAVLNYALIGRKDRPELAAPILLGAIMPDAPIIAFYAYSTLFAHVSNANIWGNLYFQSSLQNCFDLFHSMAVMLVLLALAWWSRSSVAMVFVASMILHIFVDIPLHGTDAHRLFYPLGDYKYISPIGDYPRLCAILEGIVCVPAGLRIAATTPKTWAKALAAFITIFYAWVIIFNLIYGTNPWNH
jgi:hypothetical protein